AVPKLPTVPEDGVKAAAEALRSAGAAGMLLLSGLAVREKGLELAGRIAAKTGCRVKAQGSNARVQRGAGRFAVNRIPYPVDQALAVLKDVSKLVLVGAKHPVAFFAYPDKPSLLTPADCHVLPLATLEQDMLDALERLADAVGAKATEPKLQKLARPDLPSGALNPDSIAAILGALLPENAIVCDESVTTGRGFYPLTAGAPPHDWLQNMGGSIGLGLPLATGCAVACPDRKVVCLEGDGSGMYTVQSLWTMAREKLDVTVLVFANRTYQILKGELANVGAGNPGRKAMDMLEIGRPDLDWVSMARSMGVEAGRASTAEELAHQFQAGLRSEGPYLIEVML
ncbi:MAG TPA: acetolactate synthase large subunit, partial [Kaistia sp.]|nr:acetolactate synthase large subunit [Kaistia sp.]